MRKLLVLLVASALVIWPLVAGAQQTRPQADRPSGTELQRPGDRPMDRPMGGAAEKPMDQAQMRQIEESLKAAGFDPGPVDGTFTAETDKALREFQKKQGLPEAGLIDNATRRALLSGAATPGGTTPGGTTGQPSPGAPGTTPPGGTPSPGGSTGGTTGR